MPPMNIALTGFMGTGKTSVGKVLARMAYLKFIDADDLIEEKARMSIKDIFERLGEAHFRTIEKEVIEMVTSTLSDAVFSTGGGAVADSLNRTRLKSWGTLVCLCAESKTILKRIGSGDERPLLTTCDKRETIEKLLKERDVFYKDSHLFIDTTRKTVEDAAKEILNFIRRAGGEPTRRVGRPC